MRTTCSLYTLKEEEEKDRQTQNAHKRRKNICPQQLILPHCLVVITFSWRDSHPWQITWNKWRLISLAWAVSKWASWLQFNPLAVRSIQIFSTHLIPFHPKEIYPPLSAILFLPSECFPRCFSKGSSGRHAVCMILNRIFFLFFLLLLSWNGGELARHSFLD